MSISKALGKAVRGLAPGEYLLTVGDDPTKPLLHTEGGFICNDMDTYKTFKVEPYVSPDWNGRGN